VVDAGANDRQTERGVDGPIKGQGLYRDVPLIVVHTHDAVEFAPLGRNEGRIGRHRSGHVIAALLGRGDGRGDDTFFLACAEEAMFAGVRVQPTDEQFRRAAADAFQSGGRQFDHIENALRGEQGGHLGITAMHGHERAGDFLGVLHHAGPGRAGAGGEDFGMAGEMDVGQMQGLFAQGGGRDADDLPGQRRIDGRIDVAITGLAGGGVNGAGRERRPGDRL